VFPPQTEFFDTLPSLITHQDGRSSYTNATFVTAFSGVMKRWTNTKLSIIDIRRLYITNQYTHAGMVSVDRFREIARAMGHSFAMQQGYRIVQLVENFDRDDDRGGGVGGPAAPVVPLVAPPAAPPPVVVPAEAAAAGGGDAERRRDFFALLDLHRKLFGRNCPVSAPCDALAELMGRMRT
jgi:hypothetical protein